jgi:hypothetical protein
VLLPILALDLLYVVGIVRLWRRAGLARGVPVWRRRRRCTRATLPFPGPSSTRSRTSRSQVMLLPGGLIYLGAGLALLAAWLESAGRRHTARPKRPPALRHRALSAPMAAVSEW